MILLSPLDTGVTLGSSVRSGSAVERPPQREIAGRRVIAGFTHFHMRSGVARPRFPALTSGGSSYRAGLPAREGEL